MALGAQGRSTSPNLGEGERFAEDPQGKHGEECPGQDTCVKTQREEELALSEELSTPCGWSLEGRRKSVSQEAKEGPAGGAFRGQLAPKDLKDQEAAVPFETWTHTIGVSVSAGKIPTWVLHTPRSRSLLATPARELFLGTSACFLVDMLCFVIYTCPPGLSECPLQTLTFSSAKPLCFLLITVVLIELANGNRVPGTALNALCI